MTGNGQIAASSGQQIEIENTLSADTSKGQHLVLRNLHRRALILPAREPVERPATTARPNRPREWALQHRHRHGVVRQRGKPHLEWLSIQFEISDRDDGATDNTAVDWVTFTITNASTGAAV